MKEADWSDCISYNKAKAVSPDIPRAESLIETARERISLVKEITEKNCNFVFEDYYTSIMEMLQAIAFKQGYNVLNHICIGYLIRDVLKMKDMFRIFDDLRYKRNSLTYYGKRMEFATAKSTIDKCKEMIEELDKLL